MRCGESNLCRTRVHSPPIGGPLTIVGPGVFAAQSGRVDVDPVAAVKIVGACAEHAAPDLVRERFGGGGVFPVRDYGGVDVEDTQLWWG